MKQDIVNDIRGLIRASGLSSLDDDQDALAIFNALKRSTTAQQNIEAIFYLYSKACTSAIETLEHWEKVIKFVDLIRNYHKYFLCRFPYKEY